MKLTFLGTGTSTGVPQIGCKCQVCQSADFRDKRLRTSALLEIDGLNILIDCGPDFRTQILRMASPELDALLLTHSHYDHIGGVDDLRPYCIDNYHFPIYAEEDVIRRIQVLMPYSVGPHPYPGAPKLKLETITPFVPFVIERHGKKIEVTPLRIMHSPGFGILGFKINNLAYITDCKEMPAETLDIIKDQVDVLVINALRHQEHRSHLNLSQALDVIKSVRPKKAYLTHASHELGKYADILRKLPENVVPAYDRLCVKI